MNLYQELEQKDNVFVAPGGRGETHPRLPRMPVFNADEVTKVLALTHPSKRPSLEHFKLAPPFNRFFIQATLPKGFDFLATSNTVTLAEDDKQVECSKRDLGMDVNVSEDAPIYLAENFVLLPNQFRWALTCNLYYSTEAFTDPLCLSNYKFMLILDKEGALVPLTVRPGVSINEARVFKGRDGGLYSAICSHAYANGGDSQNFMKIFREYYSLFYAMNALYSKHAFVIDIPPSRQAKRDAQRKGKQEPPTYKEIKIKDFLNLYKGAMKAKGEGRDYPLHEVMGHFARYGAEYGRKPHVSGFEGLMWISPYLRGNPDKGVTEHDYKIGEAA